MLIKQEKLREFCRGLRNVMRSPPLKPRNPRGCHSYFYGWAHRYELLAMVAFDFGFGVGVARKLLGDSAWADVSLQRYSRQTSAPVAIETFFRIGACQDWKTAAAFGVGYLKTPEGRRGAFGPRGFRSPEPDDHFWHLANTLALFHAGGGPRLVEALDELTTLPPRKWRKYSDPWFKSMIALAVHCLTSSAPDPWKLLCSMAHVNEKMFAADIKDLHYDAWFAEIPLAFAAAAQQRGWEVPDSDPHPSMPLGLLRLPPMPVPDYPWDQPPEPDPELVRAIERVAKGLPPRKGEAPAKRLGRPAKASAP